MCRQCGAIVGAGQSVCGQCGTPVPGAVTAQPEVPLSRHERETIRFARALLRRPATFTVVFLLANVFIFSLMTFKGGTSNPETLAAFGAKYNSLINQGEWWRFVTPVFIHIGFIHLFFNMYGLWVLGPYVERLYGSAKFVVFWILTGIAGVAASYLTVRPGMENASALSGFFFRSQDGPSAGASGALFGLIGVLFVFGIKFRHELPEGFKRAFGTGMLPTILINLSIGYIFPFIDNSAHVGGLLAGMALATVVSYKRVGTRGSVTVIWHILQIAALALVAVSFALVASHFGRPAPVVVNTADKVAPYIQAINYGRATFERLAIQGDDQSVPTALKLLQSTPALDEQSGILRDDLRLLILRAGQLVARRQQAAPSTGQTRETQAAEADLGLAYQAWLERFNLWVELDGKKYGVQLNKEAPQ